MEAAIKYTRTYAIPRGYLTIKQTAEIIGLSSETLRQRMAPQGRKRWSKPFEIPARKHNKIWIFRADDVRKYMLEKFGDDIAVDSM